MRRKEGLFNDQVYHVFSKSIAGFVIFNSERDFVRMRKVIKFYQVAKQPWCFSRFIEFSVIVIKNHRANLLIIFPRNNYEFLPIFNRAISVIVILRVFLMISLICLYLGYNTPEFVKNKFDENN